MNSPSVFFGKEGKTAVRIRQKRPRKGKNKSREHRSNSLLSASDRPEIVRRFYNTAAKSQYKAAKDLDKKTAHAIEYFAAPDRGH